MCMCCLSRKMKVCMWLYLVRKDGRSKTRLRCEMRYYGWVFRGWRWQSPVAFFWFVWYTVPFYKKVKLKKNLPYDPKREENIYFFGFFSRGIFYPHADFWFLVVGFPYGACLWFFEKWERKKGWRGLIYGPGRVLV